MLTLRDEQVAVLRDDVRARFEEAIAGHLREYFPGHCAAIGPAAVAATVHCGVERAAKYDLRTRREVVLWTALMFLLGSAFDRDVQYPWVLPTLAAPGDGFTRVQRLYDRAMHHLDAIRGEDGREDLRYLLRLHRLDFHAASRRDTSFLLTELYPSKASVLGADILERTIRGAAEEARRFGLTTRFGITFHTLLVFTLGDGLADDPQYPWAGKVLRETPAGIRGDVLHRVAMQRLERGLREPRNRRGVNG